jgi:hypothetical protein
MKCLLLRLEDSQMRQGSDGSVHGRTLRLCRRPKRAEANEGCLTVFTAVNYLGQMNNGSVATVGSDVQIEVHVLPAMFKDAKTKWKPLWPPWLLHKSPVKSALDAGIEISL